MARRNPRRNISRIEHRNAVGSTVGGWEVRLQRRRKKTSRYFSDSSCGGKLAALRAAKEFRDQLEMQADKLSVAEKAKSPSMRNQSGIVGVRLHRQKDRHGDYEYHYWYWVAQWTDGHGRRKTRSYSIGQYGDREAYRLACQARRDGVASAKR